MRTGLPGAIMGHGVVVGVTAEVWWVGVGVILLAISAVAAASVEEGPGRAVPLVQDQELVDVADEQAGRWISQAYARR